MVTGHRNVLTHAIPITFMQLRGILILSVVINCDLWRSFWGAGHLRIATMF